MLDNGGLKYFFEGDWPSHPPYSIFSAAYRRIGSVSTADCIDAAVECFPFQDPHVDRDARRKFMGERYDPERFGVSAWEDCGDDDVWPNLVRYARLYSEEFGLADS